MTPKSTAVFAALIAGLTTVFAQPGSADPRPAGAKVPDAAALSRLYTGKTDIWEENCNGGIYYGPDSQARAWCGDEPDSIGAGSWTIEGNGDVCQNLKWYYRTANGARGSDSDRTCVSHLVDRRGRIWRSWPDSDQWWPVVGEADDEGLVPGYRFQQDVRQAQRRLGL